MKRPITDSGGKSDITLKNFHKLKLIIQDLMLSKSLSYLHSQLLLPLSIELNFPIGESEVLLKLLVFCYLILELNSKITITLMVINGSNRTNFTLVWTSPTYPIWSMENTILLSQLLFKDISSTNGERLNCLEKPFKIMLILKVSFQFSLKFLQLLRDYSSTRTGKSPKDLSSKNMQANLNNWPNS